MKSPIDSIRIGKRHRRDMGDIESLAQSINSVGLLHPVVITSKKTLIAGERRLRAAKHLGWTTISVTVVDLDKIVRGELAENEERKDFTLSEAVAIKRAVEPEIRAAAKARMLAGKPSANLAKGEARDQVARFTGKKRTSLNKAAAVVAAAEAEPDNPKIKRLVEAMDKSGRVNGPYRRLMNMRQAAALRAEPPPLPNKGPYPGAKIDFPWAYEPDDENAEERGVLPYSTMSIKQACAFARDKIAPILHEDCVLGFWVTNFILSRGLHLPVLKALGGFKPKTLVTWPKDRPGRGHWAIGQTEHFVIATRGKPVVTLSDHTTLLKGPFHLVVKGQHSSKPVEAYDFFETLFPASRYADIFSRYRHNDRWDPHGYEAPASAEDGHGDEVPQDDKAPF